MHNTAASGEPGSDRKTVLRKLSTELDEMGWRNLRLVERMLSPYSLTFPQAMVLTVLNRLGPELEMSRLAELTGLPASTITSIMDRLVHRGLAERHQGAPDRRRIAGSITEQGRKILHEMDTMRDASLSTMLETFSDEELAVLLKLIDRWASLTDTV